MNKQVLSLSELVQTNARVPPALIESLCLTRTNILLTAPPGTGKSFLMLYILQCLSAGLPVFGSRAVKGQHRCLFIGDDAPPWYYHLQVLAVNRGLQSPDLSDTYLWLEPGGKLTGPAFLHLPPSRVKTDSPFAAALEARLGADDGPTIVMFDTLRRFHNLNERQDEHMAPLVEYLKWLRATYNVTTIWAHHERKSQQNMQSTGTDKSRGSTELPAGFDAHWSLSKYRKVRKYKLSLEKVRGFSEDELEPIWYTMTNIGTQERPALSFLPVDGESASAGTDYSWLPWQVNESISRGELIQRIVKLGKDPTRATRMADNAIAWLRFNNKVVQAKRGIWTRVEPS